jgi:hypothetical protein
MKHLHLIIAGVCFATAAWFLYSFRPPVSWTLAGVFAVSALALAIGWNQNDPNALVRLKGFSWTREDFCRGWLITGDTGSGKTRSGINSLLFQIFLNDPHWGGLCIDDKGIYWETLSEMATHFGRQGDLILLQVRPENAPAEWKPLHTFNLISDRTIPFTTNVKFVIDTATSLGQS